MDWHAQPRLSFRGHSRSHILAPTYRSCVTWDRQSIVGLTFAVFWRVSEITGFVGLLQKPLFCMPPSIVAKFFRGAPFGEDS